MTKLAEYQQWGVPNVWLVDPAFRRLSVYRDGNLTSVPAFTLSEFEIPISAAEIFR